MTRMNRWTVKAFKNLWTFSTSRGACAGVTITRVLGESNRLSETERGELIQCAKGIVSDNQGTNNNNKDDKLIPSLCRNVVYRNRSNGGPEPNGT